MLNLPNKNNRLVDRMMIDIVEAMVLGNKYNCKRKTDKRGRKLLIDVKGVDTTSIANWMEAHCGF